LPSYEFTGPGQHVYPETRDASSRPLGTVDPGDRRFFDDGPPDGMWSEVTGEQDPPADGEDPGGEAEALPEDPAPQPGQPVPPAVIPGT
jgi:hypothetical protein